MNYVTLQKLRLLGLAGLLLGLSACGGSTSGGTSVPAPTPPPAKPTITAMVLLGGHTPDPKLFPGDNKVYVGTTAATITAGASAPSGINVVQLLIDNVYSNTAIDNNAISFSDIASGLSDGTHTFTVRAYDNAGQYTDQSLSAIVDKTAPAGSIVLPINGQTITPYPTQLSIFTNIVDSNMYTVEILVDGVSIGYDQAFNVNPVGHVGTGNYPSGTHVIQLICTDKALNSLTVSVTVNW